MRRIAETLAGRMAILNLLGFSCRERHGAPLHVESLLPGPAIAPEREPAGPTDTAAVFQAIWTGAFPALVASPSSTTTATATRGKSTSCSSTTAGCTPSR